MTQKKNFLGLDQGVGVFDPCSCLCLLEALHELLPLACFGFPVQDNAKVLSEACVRSVLPWSWLL